MARLLHTFLQLPQFLRTFFPSLSLATFRGRLFTHQLLLVAAQALASGFQESLGQPGLELQDAQFAPAFLLDIVQGEVVGLLLLEILNDVLGLAVVGSVQLHHPPEQALQEAVALADFVG
ncbi:MAG: hypothetical protein MAG451_00598 [Anaerolineales bacterium]|nr:hypothetical protein [Anaerolineales bacterium]